MDPFTSIGAAANTGLSIIAKLFNAIKDYGTSYYKDSSLPEATKLARVEPITIVSKDLLNNPETRVILNSALSMFVGHYLQAIDILTKVQDVEVVRLLDKLNPDRDETGFLMSNGNTGGTVHRGFESYRSMSTQSMMFRLPTRSMPALEQSGEDRHNLHTQIILLERDKEALQNELNNMDADNANLDHKRQELEGKIEGLNQKLLQYREVGGGEQEVELDTLINMSIGRLINVKIAYTKHDGGHDQNRFVTVPINFRLLVSSIPNEAITRIMTYKSEDLTLFDRYHKARAGAIETVRDLIFCQDLIDEYKKAAIQDPSNLLAEVTRRAGNAKKFGVLTKNPSLAAASTILVISDAVARECEQKLNGKMDNIRTRDKIFSNTYAMLIIVVSKEWERATFYVRGINRGADFSFKELEGKSKGSGPDIGDILKALTAGQAPSF